MASGGGVSGRESRAIGGGVAQPAATSAVANSTLRQLRRESMEWFLIEAGVALLLAVFIVWWLMRGKK